MATPNQVGARFDGRDLTFSIPRQPVVMGFNGVSLFDVMKRLAGGAWTVSEVTNLLIAGHPQKATAFSAVHRAIERNGAATYQPLALALVAAHLGIGADDATFSDENDD